MFFELFDISQFIVAQGKCDFFSGFMVISNLQSSNIELEFVLEALFVVFVAETFVESSRAK